MGTCPRAGVHVLVVFVVVLVSLSVLSACGRTFRLEVTERLWQHLHASQPPVHDGGAQEKKAMPATPHAPASDPSLGEQSARLPLPGPNPKYPGMPLLEEQLAESLVQEKPFKFYKNARGFCQLEGYELTGPLYTKGFNYEGFLEYNMSRWHRMKFHSVSNKDVTFIINSKSGSTSTRNYLSKVGKQVGSPFKLTFEAGVYRKLSISGEEKRSFVDWFFAPERHGRKHIFSNIREPYSRLDSATGTVLARDSASKRKKEVVAEKYRDAVFHSSYEHMYPQTFFLTHSRNITVFPVDHDLGPKLQRWLEDIYPGKKFSSGAKSKNKDEGGNVDKAMVQYLIDTDNRRFLRDYIYDDMLWDTAQQLKC